MIYACILIVLFVLSLYIAGKQLGISQPDVRKCYGNKTDNVATLLDRIQWANHHVDRVNFKARFLLFAIIIAFFTSIIFEKQVNTKNMFISTIIIWIVLLTTNTFFRFHADQFADYFIDNNLKQLRKKLKVPKNIKGLQTHNREFGGHSVCFRHDV